MLKETVLVVALASLSAGLAFRVEGLGIRDGTAICFADMGVCITAFPGLYMQDLEDQAKTAVKGSFPNARSNHTGNR